jgi:hypothetical protein
VGLVVETAENQEVRVLIDPIDDENAVYSCGSGGGNMISLATRHLLGLRGVSKTDIMMIMDTARQFRDILDRPVKKVPSLRGLTVVNLFSKTAPVPVPVLNWLKNAFLQTR